MKIVIRIRFILNCYSIQPSFIQKSILWTPKNTKFIDKFIYRETYLWTSKSIKIIDRSIQKYFARPKLLKKSSYELL